MISRGGGFGRMSGQILGYWRGVRCRGASFTGKSSSWAVCVEPHISRPKAWLAKKKQWPVSSCPPTSLGASRVASLATLTLPTCNRRHRLNRVCLSIRDGTVLQANAFAFFHTHMHLEPVTATIVHVCPRTGRSLQTKTYGNTRITFAIDESNKKCLVVGTVEKLQQDFYVDGGVRIHAKFATQGKATLTMVRRNIQIMLSDADPESLIGWCRSLMSGQPPPPKADQPKAELPPAPMKRPMAPSTSASANSPTPMSRSVAGPSAAATAPSRKMERPPSASSPSASSLSPATARMLTSEQQEVLREVILGGKSVFFTGGAGTGKSFLLKQIVARLDPRTTFVTASTGIAACAVGGTTIHHFAGIGGFSLADKSLDELVRMALSKRGAQWRACKALVIDEVSMIDGQLFDLLDTIARRVRGSSKPFGGLQLVLVGDFFQLPPVTKQGGAPCKFAFEAAAWAGAIQRTFELSKVFRQSDPAFVRALNWLRVGRAPPEARQLLGGRVGSRLPQTDGIVATRLFTHKVPRALGDAQPMPSRCPADAQPSLSLCPRRHSPRSLRSRADSPRALAPTLLLPSPDPFRAPFAAALPSFSHRRTAPSSTRSNSARSAASSAPSPHETPHATRPRSPSCARRARRQRPSR
jgi:hypothetical protein